MRREAARAPNKNTRHFGMVENLIGCVNRMQAGSVQTADLYDFDRTTGGTQLLYGLRQRRDLIKISLFFERIEVLQEDKGENEKSSLDKY